MNTNTSLKSVAQPGLMLSNIWQQSRLTEGATLEALEFALGYEFFEGIQTVDVPHAKERQSIGRIIAERDIPLTYCMARVLNLNGLDLSSADKALRPRSVAEIIARLDDGREINASLFHVLSGPKPESEEERAEALKRLTDSVASITEAAAEDPKLTIMIEPLDLGYHKKMTLGYAREGVEIVKAVRQSYPNIGVGLDTAHMILNGEDSSKELRASLEQMVEFHFCNCIMDPSNPLDGDNHVIFGEPGELDVDGIAEVMRAAVDCGFFNPENRARIFCEIIRRDETPEFIIEHQQKALEDAWALANS